MSRDIERNQLAASSSLRDVLERLNEGVFGAVFVINTDGCVLGMLTDGDVRRC